MTKYEVTQRVKRYLFDKTKEEVSKEIGISRPTLDVRLQKDNWKASEIFLIRNLKV